MDCCQCRGIEAQFDRSEAEHKLRAYRRSGPPKSTRILIDAIIAEQVDGMTLLDIGGGVGAIQHALLQAGVVHAIDVDASSAYLDVARSEAERQSYADRITFQHGDFVALAESIPQTDIVTLDRVICCYHDMPALVGRSAAKARRLYGLVYPRNSWWMQIGVKVVNFMLWLQRTPFRVFAHSSSAVDDVVRRAGLEPRFVRTAGIWQIVVYAHPATPGRMGSA